MPIPRVNKNYQGKVSYFDYDAMLDLPDDTCLYCLSPRDVALILASLEPLGWKTRYFSAIDTPISQDTIDGWQVSIQAALMSDVCSEIMSKLDTIIDKEEHILTEISTLQTDLDVSQTAQDVAIAGVLAEITATVEPAIALLATAIAGIASQTTTILSDVGEIGADVDNIETVITDPVDGLAEVSQDVDSIELTIAKIKNQTTIINNNTLITVNFGLPDQTFSSDSTDVTAMQGYARYNALCQAVLDFILIEGWNMIDILNGTTADLNTVAALIAAQVQDLIYAVQLNSSVVYSASTVTGAMTDSAAVNDVACAMISYLANLSPTPGNFAAALSAYTPPALPDNRKIIYDTLQIALGALNGFQVFSAQLQPEYDAALAAQPTGYVCPPCSTVPGGCVVPATYDFSLGQKAPWLIQRGVLQPGTGVVGGYIPGDTNSGWDVSLIFPSGCAALSGKGLKFTAAHLPSGALGNTHTLEVWDMPVGGGTPVKVATSSVGQAPITWPNPTQSARFALPVIAAGRIMYMVRLYVNTAYYANATSSPCTASVLKAIDIVV